MTVSDVGLIAIGRSSSDLPDLVTHATSAENWKKEGEKEKERKRER